MEYRITTEYDGKPLRDYLRYRLRISAHLLARLKRDEQGLTVNGQRVTVRCILHEGDVVGVCDYPDETDAPIEPVDLPVHIVYEDEFMLVADKPPFMPTHPSHDHHYDTLANALAYKHRASGSDSPFVFRPISRLDRNTSGLVTIAKTKYAASRLGALMASGGFHKTYTAILDGVPSALSGEIHTGMRRTAASIIVREVCPIDAVGAESALTHYEVTDVSKSGKHSIVSVRPLTGRTHQIRVHMAHVGAPVLSDDLYGTPSNLIPRHALHATALEFSHPITGKHISLCSPLPQDMQNVCDALFNTTQSKGHTNET